MKENEEITNLERFELLIEDCKGHRELYGEFSVGEYDIEIMQHILSDYKRVLKENESYQKSDYETVCLENNELREITDRIQSEYNDLLKDNFKLKNELETKRKEYQETYKDVREEIKELKKENEEYKGYYKADKRIIHNLQKENKKYKELAEMNLKSAEEFKNNMCEHRCLLKSENEILQKENKELKESNEILNDAYWNECITKQTIKDKIEEILNNNEYRIVFEGDAEFPDEATTIKAQEYIKLDVLQELLEGRK